ncbi:MAG TPA: transcriptional regulator, partial [Ignavibacteriales bacterium]|nr:transcriptional regulator [Ignavibacteriales bacterium]
MNKHISYRSSELLTSLLQNGKSFFTLAEAGKILSKSDPAAVRRLVSDMTKRGLILRIKDGLYTIIPYEKDAEN